jgi:streptomycin 6-kinase
MVVVPSRLVAVCHERPERRAWLERLPRVVDDLASRWSLSLGAPFDSNEVSCAWVAPAVRGDGTRAVLKLGMPHLEGAHELQGLRFWNGDPFVRLLDADDDLNAMLLESCEPETRLRALPEEDQDVIVAGLLRRLWRRPPEPHAFSTLASMLAHWSAETVSRSSEWREPRLVREGLRLFDELSRPASDDVLLATDLHAGNILRAQREPWLAIDPKPFIGDRSYDATQHLLNCQARVFAAPNATIERFARLLDVDAERVRLWMFARAAAEPRDRWDDESTALAGALI